MMYKCSIVTIRKARGKNMIYNIFFGLLLVAAAWCAWQIAVADWRRRIIPDAYLWPLMLIGLVMAAWNPWWITNARMSVVGAVFGYALAAIIGFIFDWRIRRKNPDATAPIGLGDIKLIATGGIWLEVTGLAAALVISCILGLVWGKYKNQKYIPFAPFFLLGGILALLAMWFLL